jgi:hypothetical protein
MRITRNCQRSATHDQHRRDLRCQSANAQPVATTATTTTTTTTTATTNAQLHHHRHDKHRNATALCRARHVATSSHDNNNSNKFHHLLSSSNNNNLNNNLNKQMLLHYHHNRSFRTMQIPPPNDCTSVVASQRACGANRAMLRQPIQWQGIRGTMASSMLAAANALVQGQRVGTFLVRESSQPGCFRDREHATRRHCLSHTCQLHQWPLFVRRSGDDTAARRLAHCTS